MGDFMQSAIEEARSGMLRGDGGPFGAVIVRDGAIIARGHNEVLSSNDPTAHSEIVAIRRASALLGRYDLSDCTIFSTCEPCPMCFAAIHWARFRELVYACTKDDAAAAGFDDSLIYDIIRGTGKSSPVAISKRNREAALPLFGEWEQLPSKKLY